MATSLIPSPMPSSTMPPPKHNKPAGHGSAQKTTTTTSIKTTSATDGADDDADADKSGEKEDADSIAPAAPSYGVGMSGALEQKISELRASGWRPPEETIDSDDDYNAVDMISDDDDDEEKRMRKVEEKMMSFDDEEDDAALARRLSLSSASSNTTNMAYLGLNDDYLFADTPFAENFLDADQFMAVSSVFREPTPLQRTNSVESATTQRRVRFEEKVDDMEADMSDGNTTDSDADSDFFPDLFIQQDHLDPKFRQLIEKDDDHELYRDDSSNAGSEWDFEADEMRMLLMDEDEESDSSAGSSGYESDDGDTTDEEPMPPPPKKINKEASTAPTSPGSNAPTPRPGVARSKFQSRKLINKRASLQREPKMGTFIIDPHRPVLTIDGIGSTQKSTLWPARIQSQAEKQLWQRMHFLSNNNSRATSRNTSPRQSVQFTPTEDDDELSGRGMSIDSGGDFFDSLGALRTDQVIGPPEAFAPFVDVSASGNIVHDDAITGAEEEEDQDPMCFLNFDDDDEDEDMPDESDNLASPSTTASFPHLGSQQPSKGAGFDLLAHLDRRGVVGSFRRNQLFARHVGSLPSHPALRASLSESNAMQTGRRAAANTPITPLRKKKAKGVGARNSPMASPLAKSPPMKKIGPVRGGFSRH